jgi:hypothetical protein
LLGPLVGLFGQYRADKADDRRAVREDPDDVGPAADLFVGCPGMDVGRVAGTTG